MTYYAVIDTNVFISALLSKNSDSATVKVLRAIIDGRIVPLYHCIIMRFWRSMMKCFIEGCFILKKSLYRWY